MALPSGRETDSEQSRLRKRELRGGDESWAGTASRRWVCFLNQPRRSVRAVNTLMEKLKKTLLYLVCQDTVRLIFLSWLLSYCKNNELTCFKTCHASSVEFQRTRALTLFDK